MASTALLGLLSAVLFSAVLLAAVKSRHSAVLLAALLGLLAVLLAAAGHAASLTLFLDGHTINSYIGSI